MGDAADEVTRNAEREQAQNRERSRRNADRMQGAAYCLLCGERNDRQSAGYGVCSDCWESS